VHVPLIVHVPGAEASRIAARRSAIDIAPTILHLMGAPRPSEPTAAAPDDFLSGASLVPEIFGEAKPAPRDVFVDMPAGPYNDARRALIHDDLKLMVSNDAKFALYDLAKDPGETKDLSKSDPDAMKAMKDRYAALKASLREIQVTGKKK
jgi:choline-sulfatase